MTSPAVNVFGVADEIRTARHRAGLNQTELGKAVGVSKTTISNWESGRGEPTITEWRAIAAATQCDWLLGKGVSMVTKDDTSRNLRDVSELRLFPWSEAS